MHPEVAAYLEAAPAAQRPILVELRAMILEALPGAEEDLQSGFPVYLIGGRWAAGFATRAKGPMLYIMAPGVLDAWETRLDAIRSGKSCIDFKATRAMPLDELCAAAREMLREAARAMQQG